MPGKNYIQEQGLQQFHDEIEKWKWLLNSMREDNIYLKNKLSAILKNNYDQSSLEDIENFQTEFIKEDELINLLKMDINELENLLGTKISVEGKIEKAFSIKMEKMRKDITRSEIGFRIIKSSFNDFQYKVFSKCEK